MTRNSMNTVSGLRKSVMLVVVAGSLGLVGCGSELSTAPVISTSSQDEPGELTRPTKDNRVEAARGFRAESLGGNAVSLTWIESVEEVTAVLSLDGIEIARTSGKAGVYLDTMGKPAGLHTYTICFVKGKLSSRDVHAMVTIEEQGDNDGGRTDDRPELDD